jgi:hypothetical protein
MKNFIPKLIVLTFAILFSLNGFSQSAKYIPTAGIDPLGGSGASIDMQQPAINVQSKTANDYKKSNDYSIDANKNVSTESTLSENKTDKIVTSDKFRSLLAFSNNSVK